MRTMQAFIHFPSTFTPIRSKCRGISSARVPVCVLQTPGSATSPTKLQPSTNNEPRTSIFYRELPDSLPKSDHPPAPPFHRSVPLLGYLLEHVFKLSTPTSRSKRYGGVYTSNFLVGRMHFVAHPKAIVDMLKNPDIFRSAGSSDFISTFFGDHAIALLDGPRHAKTRVAIKPAFSPALFPVYLDIIRAEVEKSWTAVERSVKEEGKAFLDPAFRELFMTLVGKLTMSIDLSSDDASHIRRSCEKVVNAFFSPRFGPTWKEAMVAKQEILEMVQKIIDVQLVENAVAIEQLRAHGDVPSYPGIKRIMRGDVNLLTIITAFSDLKTGKGQKNDPEHVKVLAEGMFGLFFAGYTTSAVTATCAAFELGMNDSIWAQLTAEQDNIVSRTGSKVVEYDQVASQMPLLDSFIMEMLRMYPASIGLPRKVSRDVEVLGRRIEAGSLVFCDSLAAMRDEDMYENPDVVKVDRFVRRKGEKPPAKILTFGGPGSPHYCIGAALSGVLLKTTLAILLREYTMELDPKQSKEFSLLPEIVPKSKVVVGMLRKRN